MEGPHYVSGAERTTRMDWSPMRYSQKSPTSGISSSLHATFVTPATHKRSNSNGKSRARVPGPRDDVVRPNQDVFEVQVRLPSAVPHPCGRRGRVRARPCHANGGLPMHSEKGDAGAEPPTGEHCAMPSFEL